MINVSGSLLYWQDLQIRYLDLQNKQIQVICDETFDSSIDPVDALIQVNPSFADYEINPFKVYPNKANGRTTAIYNVAVPLAEEDLETIRQAHNSVRARQQESERAQEEIERLLQVVSAGRTERQNFG